MTGAAVDNSIVVSLTTRLVVVMDFSVKTGLDVLNFSVNADSDVMTLSVTGALVAVDSKIEITWKSQKSGKLDILKCGMCYC